MNLYDACPGRRIQRGGIPLKRILTCFLPLGIPLLIFRLGTLRHTDPGTGYYLGGHPVLCIAVLCFLILFCLAFALLAKREADRTAIDIPFLQSVFQKAPLVLSAALSILLILFRVPQVLSGERIQTILLLIYLVFHGLAAWSFLIIAFDLPEGPATLSDLLDAAPAAAFASELLLRYSVSPINLHDSVSVLRVICACALAMGWLRAASSLIGSDRKAFAVSAGTGLFAFFCCTVFQLPELPLLRCFSAADNLELMLQSAASVALLIFLSCMIPLPASGSEKMIFRKDETELPDRNPNHLTDTPVSSINTEE